MRKKMISYIENGYRTRANPYKGLWGTAALLKEVSDLGGPNNYVKKYSRGVNINAPYNNKQFQKEKLRELEDLLTKKFIS